MGREIELKIPLSDIQYKYIEEYIFENKNEEIHISDIKRIYKKDEYFSQYNTENERQKNNEPQVIRIRTEDDNKSYFTIKRKKYDNGIEVNKEDESFIEDISVIRSFLDCTGFKKWFYKEKQAVSFYANKIEEPQFIFHCELVIVNDLKYFEIEITNQNYETKLMIEKLNDFVKVFKLDSNNRDSRSWVEILNSCLSS